MALPTPQADEHDRAVEEFLDAIANLLVDMWEHQEQKQKSENEHDETAPTIGEM